MSAIDLARSGPDTPMGGLGARSARRVMDGEVPFQGIDDPYRVRVEDFAVQAGQGRIADRENERLGRGDHPVARMPERELRAMERGERVKQWSPAPADVAPTLGF